MKHLIPTNSGLIDAKSVKKLIPIRNDKDQLIGYDAIMNDGTTAHLTKEEGKQIKNAK